MERNIEKKLKIYKVKNNSICVWNNKYLTLNYVVKKT